MSTSNRSASFLSRQFFQKPENIGNKKSFEETKLPPDDVGNRIERDAIKMFIHDGLGNSIDEEPSHLKSGILMQIIRSNDRSFPRSRNVRPDRINPQAAVFSPLPNSGRIKRPISLLKNIKTNFDSNGENYMFLLAKEFQKLLGKKMGLPFSFSMKPILDEKFDESTEMQALESIKKLIEDILKTNAIKALVKAVRYRTKKHRFIVFFLNPEERDAAKNKDLVSALRQVVRLYEAKISSGQLNILLVLDKAISIIENHLSKLGAVKVNE